MKARVEEELRKIIGIQLESIGRVCDLEWFSFGEKHIVLDPKGQEREVCEYAIHVQCAWRIIGSEGLIIASRDCYIPREGWQGNEEDFQWDEPGETLRDQKTKEFFDNLTQPLFVDSVEADNIGGFRLHFSGNYILEVFPDSLDEEGENWRFFQPWSGLNHFVLSGKKLTD